MQTRFKVLQSFTFNSILCINNFASVGTIIISVSFEFLSHLKHSLIYREIFTIGKDKLIR